MPVETFQKEGLSWTAFGTSDDTNKCVLDCLYARKILACDAEQTGVSIVQPGRDKSAGDEIGGAFTENWPNVAKGTNVVETRFRENCDVRVEGKRLVESDTK